MKNKLFSNKVDYVLCGLGNPEPKYKNHRHNIGKLFLNFLARDIGREYTETKAYNYYVFECENPNRNKKLPRTKILCVKLNTFMNVHGPLLKDIMTGLELDVTSK